MLEVGDLVVRDCTRCLHQHLQQAICAQAPKEFRILRIDTKQLLGDRTVVHYFWGHEVCSWCPREGLTRIEPIVIGNELRMP